MQPDEIIRLLQGYQTTAIVRAGITLGMFAHLAGGAADATTVAQAIGADARGTRILLDALTALGLLRRQGQTYGLTPAAETYLVPDRPTYLGDLIHLFAHEHFWEAFQRLPEAVRRGGTVLDQHAETPAHAFWEDFATYSAAIAGPAAETLAALLAPWAAARPTLDLLDVACGTGLYGFTLARRYLQARVWALDWPNVLPLTRSYAERLGVAERVQFIAGDMFTVPLGGPYDLIILSHVLHHFAEERATALLHRCAAHLKPDGRLVIHDFIPNDQAEVTDPVPHLFSVVMLVWTRAGEAHPLSRYQRMLSTAGFALPAVHPLATQGSCFLLAERVPR